jgi:methanogenic corrinoid protein MtbC1
MYSEGDLALIRRMAALVSSGFSAASAAAAVHDEAATPSILRATVPMVPSGVLALVDAAQAYDESLVLETLDAAERAMGIETAVEHLVLPALVEAGRRWERSDMTVAAEHLLAEAARLWLAARSHALPAPPRAAPHVLVACPEDERHDLGALALAVLLRRAGVRVAYLGADVPTATLVEATRSTRLDALCLSITSAPSLPVARIALGALHGAGGGVRLYVGGPAIVRARDEEADALAAVRLPASVVAAATMVASQLLATRAV